MLLGLYHSIPVTVENDPINRSSPNLSLLSLQYCKFLLQFIQERLWKMTAAAQLCRHAVSSSHLRFDRQSQQMKLRKVAYTLAEAVMHFWHSAEELLNNEGECLSLDLGGIQQELDCSRQNGSNEVSEGKTGDSVVKVVIYFSAAPANFKICLTTLFFQLRCI